MTQENQETRTFSRVFNICKPCLRLNVHFFYESSGQEVKRRGRSIQRGMKGMKSLQRRVTGNPENNIVHSVYM